MHHEEKVVLLKEREARMKKVNRLFFLHVQIGNNTCTHPVRHIYGEREKKRTSIGIYPGLHVCIEYMGNLFTQQKKEEKKHFNARIIHIPKPLGQDHTHTHTIYGILHPFGFDYCIAASLERCLMIPPKYPYAIHVLYQKAYSTNSSRVRE
jgi:hypothetical protein